MTSITTSYYNSFNQNSGNPDVLAAEISRSLIRLEQPCFVVRTTLFKPSSFESYCIYHTPVSDIDDALALMKSLLAMQENRPFDVDILYVRSATDFIKIKLQTAADGTESLQFIIDDETRISVNQNEILLHEIYDIYQPAKLVSSKQISADDYKAFKLDLFRNPSALTNLSLQ